MQGGVYDDSPLTTIRSYVNGLNISDSKQRTELINQLSQALGVGADFQIGQMTISDALNKNSLWTDKLKPDAIGDSFKGRTQNQQEPKEYPGDIKYREGVIYDGEIAHHNEQNHLWQDGHYVRWALNGLGHAIDNLFRGRNPFGD